MKYLLSFSAAVAFICLGCAQHVVAQSGRPRTTPTAPEQTYRVPEPDNPAQSSQSIKQDSRDEKTYYCGDDAEPITKSPGDTSTAPEEVFSPRDVTTKAQILSKPNPGYTLEARRNGTSGRVQLRLLLSSTGRITTVRVLKGLPDGLTESSVKAACQIRFKPAIKDDKPVSQHLIVEYGFWMDMRYGPRTRQPPPSTRP